jgi:hypothetical protein
VVKGKALHLIERDEGRMFGTHPWELVSVRKVTTEHVTQVQ